MGEQSNRTEENDQTSKYLAIGAVVAAVAGVALVAWGASKLFPEELVAWGVSKLFSGDGKSKMMKAPGRPGVFIPRAEFESDATAYFRHLRS